MSTPEHVGEQFHDDAVQEMIRQGFDVHRGTHGTYMRAGEGKHKESGGFGTHVVPAREHGKGALYDLTHTHRAYYSAAHPNLTGSREAEQSAWNWSAMAVEQAVSRGSEQVAPRAIVHHVVPEGRLGTDPVVNKSGTMGAEMTADRLRITRTDWIPRPREGSSGYQGTLPYVNWNQFSSRPKEGHSSIEDANFVHLDFKAARDKLRQWGEAERTAQDEWQRKRNVERTMGRMF
jgi:hypothetical protein